MVSLSYQSKFHVITSWTFHDRSCNIFVDEIGDIKQDIKSYIAEFDLHLDLARILATLGGNS